MNPILESFYAETLKELSVLGSSNGKRPLRTVYQKVHSKIDKVFATELERSGSKVACCAGCFYCCHIKVDIFPGEAFLIASFMRENFSAEQRESVLQTAKENWKKIEPMSYDEQFVAHLACPLLKNGRCSVYSVRPSFCRSYHTTDVQPCKAAFEQPDLLHGPDYTVPTVRQSTALAIVGSEMAVKKGGFDSMAYDINGALIECLTNSHSEKRWRTGKSAFPKNMRAKEPQKGVETKPFPV